ncbi:MAG: hydrogenobyrinic acid a,c-diamide synthase (glutamine-hydrolyzing) [Gammaproteobacteria bacterium]|nr:MAG: hydrogenobyrinic acid a,c-diamide synthase (glutamine-hydrolyzing) [Gammaproteobacteria bacterium]
MARLLISAAHKSSGKTTITIGLCAALAERGLNVHPFKKGPDYIDPMWLGRAAGHPCHNLDFYTMDKPEIVNTVYCESRGSDIAIIEGNKGLYDGLDLDGSNSNAALAALVKAPVVLVLDARGMTRGIAPLILGYQAFDSNIHIAGVILNKLGGKRHESKLRSVIEYYTDVQVVGAVGHDPALSIEERHLGLIPSNEDDSADRKIIQIRDGIKQQIDLDRIIDIAQSAPELPAVACPADVSASKTDVRIGIARNDAFGFYYPGDLQALERAGAELVYIDPIRESQLPDIDGLFIGGGFPESRMQELESNRSMRESIKNAIENGLPSYAECGGLMYLSRQLKWNDQCNQMVGIIPADTVMYAKPQGRGYIRLEETANHPWKNLQPLPPADIAGHEFHYSALENLDPSLRFAYRILRGTGIDGQNDGIVYKNLLASYAHLRDTSRNHWAQRFVKFVRQCKK